MRVVRNASIVAVVIALVLPATALAAGAAEGRVVLGGSYTLEAGQSLDGDLIVVGGVATLEAGSRVEGDVVVVGGLLSADGGIRGDLLAIGGIVNLGEEASVGGDLIGAGAVVERSPGSQVRGQVIEEGWSRGWSSGPWGFHGPSVWDRTGFRWAAGWLSPIFALGWWIVRSLLMAGLAALIAGIWPDRTARVARAIVEQPIQAGAFGLGTCVLAAVVIVALALTLCLIPFSVIAALLLAAAWAFGWAGLGLAIGWRMSQFFRRDWQAVTQAGLGTLALSLAAGGFDLIPCVGWAVPALLGFLGLGAVVQTRFGGQDPSPSSPTTVAMS